MVFRKWLAWLLDRLQPFAEGPGVRDPRKPSAATIDPRGSLDPEKENNLKEFRILTGIETEREMVVPNALSVRKGKRAGSNLGIYHRVVENEQKAASNFTTASYLINFCLILQIIVAAALTALGAANSSHKAVTTFGAINTVIAGSLTWLKGSGLPNRLKYYEEEWKRVREHIELRERQILRGAPDVHVHDSVKEVEKLYIDVQNEVSANTPDAYVSINAKGQRDKHGELLHKLSLHGPRDLESGLYNEKFQLPNPANKAVHFADEKAEAVTGTANQAAHGAAGKFAELKDKYHMLSGAMEHYKGLAAEIGQEAKAHADSAAGHADSAAKHAATVAKDAQDVAKDGGAVVEEVKHIGKDADPHHDAHS